MWGCVFVTVLMAQEQAVCLEIKGKYLLKLEHYEPTLKKEEAICLLPFSIPKTQAICIFHALYSSFHPSKFVMRWP